MTEIIQKKKKANVHLVRKSYDKCYMGFSLTSICEPVIVYPSFDKDEIIGRLEQQNNWNSDSKNFLIEVDVSDIIAEFRSQEK